MIAKLHHNRLRTKPDNKLDWALLFLIIGLSAVSLLVSEKLFIGALAAVVLITISLDRFIFYKSTVNLLLPLILLIVIGLFAGLRNSKIDYLRDIIIFGRNIVFIIAGIALSKYIKNTAHFFQYFLIVAFLASLVHIARIGIHLGEITSLQTIRTYAGFSNSVEGIILAIAVSCMLSKKYRELIGKLKFVQKMMVLFIALSFFLYFSRTLVILLPVVCLFLCDSIYIRQILSPKNRRLFYFTMFTVSLLTILYFVSLMLPVNSPVRTLVEKFQNVPDEVTWSKERNLHASREEIQNNWRGYEAYQGMLKFNDGDRLEQIFGFGFGSRVDLGLIMKLGGKDYEDVPILHNEYVMLLVKTGIIGLLLYLAFLYMLGFSRIKRQEIENLEVYYSYQMISALSLIVVVNTYTGFGLLDPANQAIPIFIGFYLGNIQRNKVRTKNNLVKAAEVKRFEGSKHY